MIAIIYTDLYHIESRVSLSVSQMHIPSSIRVRVLIRVRVRFRVMVSLGLG